MRASRPASCDGVGRERQIAEFASRQKGNLSREQLLSTGVTAHAIDHWLRSGRLIQKFRGVYRLGHEAVPEFSDELAAVMACGRNALLSHRSAAYLWRVLPNGPSPAPIAVTVIGRRLRSRTGIRIHYVSALPASERTTHDGIPVTAPARTLLDLAAVTETRTLERALNEAHVLCLARPSTLSPLLAQHPRHPGVGAIRALIAEPSRGFTRSEAERRVLELIRAAKLPRPRANVRVGGYEVDFLWAEQRVIVEVDGFRFHASRAAFERDRARDAELAAMGFRVLRVTWRQIESEPYALVARLAQALGSAR